MTRKLMKIASDCRKAAEFYEKSPGLVGPGANPDTIIDLYRTIASVLDEINAKLPPQGERGAT